MAMKQDEFHEQCALFQYAELMSKRVPEWSLLFALPLGGERNIIVAKKLKQSGTRAGIPDIMLPVSRKGYHGLFIELKTGSGRVSAEQKQWIKALNSQGYNVVVCFGWIAAKETIESYLEE